MRNPRNNKNNNNTRRNRNRNNNRNRSRSRVREREREEEKKKTNLVYDVNCLLRLTNFLCYGGTWHLHNREQPLPRPLHYLATAPLPPLDDAALSSCQVINVESSLIATRWGGERGWVLIMHLSHVAGEKKVTNKTTRACIMPAVVCISKSKVNSIN